MIKAGSRKIVIINRFPLIFNIKLRNQFHPRYRIISSLIQKMNPSPCRVMEIGVDCGAGAKRIIETTKKGVHDKVEYYGFNLHFDNELKKMLKGTGAAIHLFEGDSRETLPQHLGILLKMDFIYIDGGHSYDVVKSDWENARLLMHPRTVVLFDDYGSAEGVKRTINEIERRHYNVEFCPFRYLEFWSFPRTRRYTYDCMAKVTLKDGN